MPLKRFIRWLSAGRRDSPAAPDSRADEVIREIRACLDKSKGPATTGDRARTAVAAFLALSPADRSRVIAALSHMAAAKHENLGDFYIRMEEADLFGSRRDRFAVFGAFDAPRRQALETLVGVQAGETVLEIIAGAADRPLAAEANEVLAAHREKRRAL